MKPVTEIDRRPPETRARDDARRTMRTPPDSIEHALHALDEHRRAWERGFVAGVTASNLARGTRDIRRPDEEDTAPYPVIDPEETP